MPRRKTLEARIAEQTCSVCSWDTPLHTDEESALDDLLSAIATAVEQAPQAARDAIMEAAKHAPRFVPGVRDKRYQPRNRHDESLLFLDSPSVQALIAELAGEI